MNILKDFYQFLMFLVLTTLPFSVSAAVEFQKTLIEGSETEAQVCLEIDGDNDVYPVFVELMAVAKADFNLWLEDNSEAAVSSYDGEERFDFSLSFINPETQVCETISRSSVTDSDSIFIYITNVVRSEHLTDLRAEILEPNSTFLNDFSIEVSQNGVTTREVLQNGGDVVVSAVSESENESDFIFAWASTDSALVDEDGLLADNTMTFDPSLLSEGLYTVQLGITSNDATRSTILTSTIKIAESLDNQLDSDLDGVSNEVEDGSDIGSISSDGDLYVQTHSDVKAVLGDLEFSLNQTTPQASIDEFEVWSGNEELNSNLFIYSALTLKLTDLEVPGGQVKVSIKLDDPTITNGAFFIYKDDRANAYSEDNQDKYMSVRSSTNNDCPVLNESLYSSTVAAGHNCLLLVITDGGENDADLLVNGQISVVGLLGRSGDVFDTNLNDEDDDNGRDSPSKMGPGSFNFFFIFSMFVMLALRYSSKAEV